MAAIVRMRRRKDEDLMHEVVMHLLKRGRQQTSDDAEESVSKKFKYAGTVDSKDISIVHPVSNAIKESKLNKLRNIVDEHKVTRDNSSQRPKKLVECKVVSKEKAKDFDSLGLSNDSVDEARYVFFDVEKNTLKKDEASEVQSEEKDGDKDEEYVYDLYYMNEYNFDYSYFEHVQNVQALRLSDNLWMEEEEECEETGDDDDDENAEDYYTNQYADPDDLILMNINDDDDDDETDEKDDDETDGKVDDDDDKEDDEEYNADQYVEQCYNPT